LYGARTAVTQATGDVSLSVPDIVLVWNLHLLKLEAYIRLVPLHRRISKDLELWVEGEGGGFQMIWPQRSLVIALSVFSVFVQSTHADFSFNGFPSAGNLRLTGDAIHSGNSIRITPSQPDQLGAVWHSSRQDVTSGFTTTFRFKMAANGADGLAFVIQNSSIDAIAPAGSGGATLGYAGIPNSVAIEFDTFDDSEPNGNHISVQTLGTAPNSSDHAASIVWYDPGYPLNGGQDHTVRVVHDSDTLRIYLDDDSVPVITSPLDIGDLLSLPDDSAWVGFTAATHGLKQHHSLLDWTFTSDTEYVMGDASGNGITSAFDATFALRHGVRKIKLHGRAHRAADVTGNGTVGAYDAALILARSVGNIPCFPVEKRCEFPLPRIARDAVTANWRIAREEDVANLVLMGTVETIQSVELSIPMMGRTLSDFRLGFPDTWHVIAHQDGDTLRIAAAGLDAILTDPLVAVITDQLAGKAPSGSFRVNESGWKPFAQGHSLPLAGLPTIGPNSPNPFNPLTSIPFDLPVASYIQIDIWSVDGRLVQTLIRDRVLAGQHTVAWNGRDKLNRSVGTGVYIVRLSYNPTGASESQSFTQHVVQRRITLLR
jgi:hypothetical protein